MMSLPPLFFTEVSDRCSRKPCWKFMSTVIVLVLQCSSIRCIDIVFTRLDDVTNKSCPDAFNLMTSTAIYKKTHCASLCTRNVKCTAFVANEVTGNCQTKSRSTRLSGTCTEETGAVHYGKLQAGCPVGFSWHEDTRMCYKLFFPCETWNASREQCNLVGTDLLVLSNPPFLTFFQELVRQLDSAAQCSLYSGFWVGATDLAMEGRWEWLDGTTVADSSWGPGLPNGGNTRDCMTLFREGNYAVDDGVCSHDYSFACGIGM